MFGHPALTAAFLFASGFAVQEAAKDSDEEAKAKIAEFRKELKNCKTDQDVARALQALGETQHPKILAELKTWLSKPSLDVAVAAAEQISKYKKDKEASDALLGAAGSRKDKDAIVKCLRYAGDVGYKPAVTKLTGYFKHREVDVAREAVDSCGKLRSRDAVDPLIGLLRELEGIRESQPGTGGGGGLGGLVGGGGLGGVQEEQQKRKRDLTPAVLSALSHITGQKFETSAEWTGWWRKNKSTFKEPE
ncbi:MAG: HEAT repeat domain-containing protein [Planctomycetota bacterium]